MTILDLFADESPAPVVEEEPILSDQDLSDYSEGRLELRPNYVHLGWHKGGSPHLKTVADLKTSQHDRGEARCCQLTVYIVPVPLPAAWLDDPQLHAKTIALEEKLLARMGLAVRHYRANAKHQTVQSDDWEQTGPAAEEWKIENCLCARCGWLREQCKCEVVK